MAQKSVAWTGTAVKQRRQVLSYWTKRTGNTAFAEKLIGLIAEKTKLILKHPEAFKPTI